MSRKVILNRDRAVLLRRSGVVAMLWVLVPAGCHGFPNVFVDGLPASERIFSASAAAAARADSGEGVGAVGIGVVGIGAVGGETLPALRTRSVEAVVLETQDGTVPHAPLWLADPTEVVASDADGFATTGGDFLYFPKGICRFLLNVGFLPISMIVHPWLIETQCSDGLVADGSSGCCSEPSDAKACMGVAMPPDAYTPWPVDCGSARSADDDSASAP